MSDAQVVRRLVIHGQVQGVGFRWATVREAERIGGLAGWVRNRRDGTVEAVAAGSAANVDALIAWARRGPSSAIVSRIDISHEVVEALPAEGFEQRPTA